MAAAGNESNEQKKPTLVKILSEEEFTIENNNTKKTYEDLKQYKDGQESIEYLPFRIFNSYEEYKSEQEMINKLILRRFENAETAENLKIEIED